jgi:allantoicase
MIELTEQQREAIQHGEAVRVQATDLGGTVVVLSDEAFRHLQQLLEDIEDRREQDAFLRASHRSAVAFMKENPYAP